jgi:hypothetical protein
MEAIPQLIFNRLAQRQAVILPGLGTLRVEHTPPRIDEAARRIVAPIDRVVFSREEGPGQTLPEIIADHFGVPLKEVKPRYNRWLAGLRRASIDGEIVVAGVGMLLRQPDGSFRVETAPELDRWLNPIEPASVPLPPPQPRVKTARKTAGKPGRKSRLARRAARLAAAGAFGAVAVYAFIYLYTNDVFDRAPVQTPTPVAAPKPVPVPEVAVPAQDSVETTMPEPVVSTAEQPAVQVSPPTAGSDAVYHLIAGVFSNRENAERCVREGGFEASQTTLIPTTGGRFMVSVGRYETMEAADAALQPLKERLPDAWISKRKH